MSAPVATLLDRIAIHAAATPDRLALAFPPTERYTWATLLDHLRRVAAHLRTAGVQPGERIAVLSDAPHQQAIGFLGAMACGAVPTILSHPSIKQSVERFVPTFMAILQRDTRWLLCSPELHERAKGWVAGANAGLRALAFPTAAELPAGGVDANAGPIAFLQYSSGTTGMRKGVAVSHAMFAAQAGNYLAAIALTDADVVASWLPLYHDMGLVACLLLPLWQGAASVHVSPFRWVQSPALLLDLIAEHRATFAWLPNFAIRVLADRVPAAHRTDLSSLRAIIDCGEPVRPATVDAFAARFGVAPTQVQCSYGMAENVFSITQTPLGAPPRRDRLERNGREVELLSSGRAVPGTEVRIRGAGGLVGDREIGEIEIRGSSLFAGYDGGGGEVDPDGWFRTGDLGYRLDGDVFVTGRSKDLIIHRGVNLHPEDVEDVIGEVPGGKPGRAVVFGVYDEAAGTESIVAMLEVAADDVDPAKLTVQVRARIYEHFGFVPSDLVVVAAGTLIKSTSGKPSRSANRAQYLEQRGRSAD